MSAWVIAAVIAWGAPPPAAASPAKKLSLQWVSAQTIHLAGNRGAINRDHFATVALELAPGGALRVVDEGHRRENNLFETYSIQEQTVWTNRWKGTWSTTADGLRFDLALAHRKCTHQKSDGAREACPKVSPRLQLICVGDTVPVDVDDGQKVSRTREPVWRCDLTGSAERGDTPMPWTLGKRACLQHGDGGGYRRCESVTPEP